MKRSVLRLSIPFRRPFATASGVVGARELLVLRLEDEGGLVGHGEAAPFEPYDGVPLELVAAALRGGPAGRDVPPQAQAAEEMARLDLEARRAGRPLGEPGAEAIAVNCTLDAGPPEEVAERARAAAHEGYACFKLKVGLPDDLERVAAVRGAIGPWPALRLDANGAWEVGRAIETINRLSEHDLQFVEQPCPTLADLAEVRLATDVPIAADEPITGPGDVRAAAETGACDVVNVKLASAGGYSAARETLRAASQHGLEAFLSSTFDGPWGIAAALQLAASERLSLACGLATLELFDASLAQALSAPKAGLLAVPQGPGLGVVVEPAALEEVLVEEVAA